MTSDIVISDRRGFPKKLLRINKLYIVSIKLRPKSEVNRNLRIRQDDILANSRRYRGL